MKYGDTREHWIILEAAQTQNTTHTNTTITKMSSVYHKKKEISVLVLVQIELIRTEC